MGKSRPVTPGRLGGPCSPPFTPPPPKPKIKSKSKEKKRKVSKKKLLKDCHPSQNVTVLIILERLEFKNFSCRPTMVADFSVFHGSSTSKSISRIP